LLGAFALTLSPAFAQVAPGLPRPGTRPGPPGAPTPAGNPGFNQPNNPNNPNNPANPAAEAGPQGPLPSLDSGDPDTVSLAAFTEPVQLKTLIDLVGQTLHINITTNGDVPGSVVFNAPVPIKKSEFIHLLNSLLEQQGYSITQNRFGWYTVQNNSGITSNIGTQLATTQVISTPNFRPSAIKASVDALTAGNAQGGNSAKYSYVDDLGVIVATDTPQHLQALKDLVAELVTLNDKTTFQRIELKHISAAVARDRALQLVGVTSSGTSRPGDVNQPGGNPGVQAAIRGGSVSSLNDRLWVDPQGNALIFSGSPGELSLVTRVLDVIDVPNTLEPKGYDVGSSAAQIANIARERGLGEVISIGEDAQDPTGQLGGARVNFQNNFNNRGQGNTGQTVTGGPVMVVDEHRGKIVYYGTPTQQEELQALVKELDTQADIITTQVFKLKNSDSDDVADIINGLISNQTPIATGNLLGSDQGANRGSRAPRQPNNANVNNPNAPARPGTNFDIADSFNPDPSTAFVISNKANNQVIVKARAKDQPQFARIIEQLDLRRPQVYVEARIIAVTANDTLRLAFEQQLINANGTGGVLNTNFGLASFASGGTLTAAKAVATGLPGFTGAIIKNDQIPIVLTALATETDSRVISHPQLLVDDNEEATVDSKDTRPTSTVSRGTGGSGDIVTSGDDAEAGTKLVVTPQISEAGYLRLKYDITLSSFTGNSTTVGSTVLKPPKQENNLKSDSVTVPSDCTVVVGGLVVDTKTKTINGVPFLKDIPLLGLLFQDRNTGDVKTVLYIFITPKILREPDFSDLKLLTRGPQSAVNLSPDIPTLKPSLISIVEPGRSLPRTLPEPMPKTGRDEAPSPPEPTTPPKGLEKPPVPQTR
jgi:type II secretory pathway component GspD/PulD (secretin)